MFSFTRTPYAKVIRVHIYLLGAVVLLMWVHFWVKMALIWTKGGDNFVGLSRWFWELFEKMWSKDGFRKLAISAFL